MLRVITQQSGEGYRVELHGLLGGEWVRLLEEHWRTLMATVPSAHVVVILSNVDFIDADGERLLRRMADAGVEFVVSGCMNRYVVGHLQPNGRRTKEGVRR